MKMLSCLLDMELAGEMELLRLASFRSLLLFWFPLFPLSSKGLEFLGPLGEWGVSKPGDGAAGGIGCGNVAGHPRTGLDGLSKWHAGRTDSVGDVTGGDVGSPGNGASKVTFGTERDRGRGEVGGIPGGDGGSMELSKKSGRFWSRLWKAKISSSGVSLGDVVSTSKLLFLLSRRLFLWWRLPKRKLWKKYSKRVF